MTLELSQLGVNVLCNISVIRVLAFVWELVGIVRLVLFRIVMTAVRNMTMTTRI